MGKIENRPSIERTTKLSDCINSFFLLGGKMMVRTRRKPSWFLLIQRKPRRMIGMKKKGVSAYPRDDNKA